MTWTAADIPDQTGRVAVVTGSNAGLGREIAARLAERGAEVVLACRNAERAERAAADIRSEVPGANVAIGSLDLASFASVSAFADRFSAEHRTLDLLINNAGLLAIDQFRTEDGFETQFQVNYLGAFALTQRLRSVIEATPGSRVATMSSVAHRPGRIHFDDVNGDRNYKRWRAYVQSNRPNRTWRPVLGTAFSPRGSPRTRAAGPPRSQRRRRPQTVASLRSASPTSPYRLKFTRSARRWTRVVSKHAEDSPITASPHPRQKSSAAGIAPPEVVKCLEK